MSPAAVGTHLKVTGIDTYSAGEFLGDATTEAIAFRDISRGVHKRLVLRQDRLVGVAMVGDARDAGWYFDLLRRGTDVAAMRDGLAFGPVGVENSPPPLEGGGGGRGADGRRATVVRTPPPNPLRPQGEGEAYYASPAYSRVMTPDGVHTTCPYCGVGCGVVAMPDGSIRGDTTHPSNQGRLCSKGAALALTLDDSERLTEPCIAGAPASWDAALDLVATRFSETIAAHGPDSVAFYVSGQCLTEDYYVANKLMKGFIGSANIDTNSRLCMASSVAGHVRAFGEDVVPGVYEDWDEADLVVLVGSNAAWCHPVLYQRLLAARAARGTQDRRAGPAPHRHRRGSPTCTCRSLPAATCCCSTGCWPIWLPRTRWITDWIARHTTGFAAALAAARADAADPAAVAAACGLDPAVLATFYDWFATTERVLTVFSQGVNQSASGTDKVNAIINCHLATGRIGRPGMGPFSVTGQPNAMGGREVGGLANQLAAHLGFDDPAHRDTLRRFWNAPRLASAPASRRWTCSRQCWTDG